MRAHDGVQVILRDCTNVWAESLNGSGPRAMDSACSELVQVLRDKERDGRVLGNLPEEVQAALLKITNLDLPWANVSGLQSRLDSARLEGLR